VYLRMHNDPLVLQYRATLSYTSAVVGDGVLIPLVNVFMTGQLALWRRRPALSEVALSVLGGALITGVVHLYQALNDLTNWTMTAPFEWTSMGYYHAAFMWAEISCVLFFWRQVARAARDSPRASGRRPRSRAPLRARSKRREPPRACRARPRARRRV